jgi:hypothetical protein
VQTRKWLSKNSSFRAMGRNRTGIASHGDYSDLSDRIWLQETCRYDGFKIHGGKAAIWVALSNLIVIQSLILFFSAVGVTENHPCRSDIDWII